MHRLCREILTLKVNKMKITYTNFRLCNNYKIIAVGYANFDCDFAVITGKYN